MTKKIIYRNASPTKKAIQYDQQANRCDTLCSEKHVAANHIEDMLECCEHEDPEDCTTMKYWIQALRVAVPTLRASAETDSLLADDLRAAARTCLETSPTK